MCVRMCGRMTGLELYQCKLPIPVIDPFFLLLRRHLQHRNVVKYLGYERLETAFHLIMEYVPGGSLTSMLLKFGPLLLHPKVMADYSQQVRSVSTGDRGEVSCVCVCVCVYVCACIFREGILATLSYSGVYSPYAQSQEIGLSKTAPRLSTSVLYQKRQRALQVRGVCTPALQVRGGKRQTYSHTNHSHTQSHAQSHTHT